VDWNYQLIQLIDPLHIWTNRSPSTSKRARSAVVSSRVCELPLGSSPSLHPGLSPKIISVQPLNAWRHKGVWRARRLQSLDVSGDLSKDVSSNLYIVVGLVVYIWCAYMWCRCVYVYEQMPAVSRRDALKKLTFHKKRFPFVLVSSFG
jgi:hypothetical protein